MVIVFFTIQENVCACMCVLACACACVLAGSSDLEGASLIVDMLQNTCSAGAWREPTQICLSKCLEQLSIMSVNQVCVGACAVASLI